jgi:Asp-tRNA(Asn)/Glu-tRNA(Gln) amidotransferase A subunit family amidase
MSETIIERRRLLQLVALTGAAQLLGAGRAEAGFEVTGEALEACDWLPGIEFTEDERLLMKRAVQSMVEGAGAMRAVPLANSVPPAMRFDPERGRPGPEVAPERAARPQRHRLHRPPASDADLAFASIADLAHLTGTRQLSSRELVRFSLDRLQPHDPRPEGASTRMGEQALPAASAADEQRAWGRASSPLHGLPWGAKDLLAARGARTTWGAVPYKDQVIDEDAAVVARLAEAGAVLTAKLSLGALAWGDVWFGGRTRNPWKLDQGSSGSSAGSASAVAAGLLPFAIGTETYGSIVSPCTRCGVTGLRPTFGRVSRQGAMALSWSMDKIGPIARSAEDCALVLDAIHGADGLDASAVSRPFAWPPERDPKSLRVGFVPELFEADATKGVEDPAQRAAVAEQQGFDRAVLQVLRDEGFRLKPVSLPSTQPLDALLAILWTEAATAFDELTRSGRDDALVRQVDWAWPNLFRAAQLVSGVDYLRANRIRSLVMDEMDAVFEQVDVYLTPSFGGQNLLLTNLTGHPLVVMPSGFSSADGTPASITITGRLFGDAEVLAVAQAYQRATGHHLQRPPLFS